MVMMKAKTSSMKVLNACHAGRRGVGNAGGQGSPGRPLRAGPLRAHVSAKRLPATTDQRKGARAEGLDVGAPPGVPHAPHAVTGEGRPENPAEDAALLFLRTTLPSRDGKTHPNRTCPGEQLTALQPGVCPSPGSASACGRGAPGAARGERSCVSPKKNIASDSRKRPVLP